MWDCHSAVFQVFQVSYGSRPTSEYPGVTVRGQVDGSESERSAEANAIASTACANPAYAGGDQGQEYFEPMINSGSLNEPVVL